MRCKADLQMELERLERELAAHLNDMMSWAGRTPLRMMLDEWRLRGAIDAIKFAMDSAAGGWPHDALFLFQDAQLGVIKSMLAAGYNWDTIIDTMNITEVKAQLLLKANEPDSKN